MGETVEQRLEAARSALRDADYQMQQLRSWHSDWPIWKARRDRALRQIAMLTEDRRAA